MRLRLRWLAALVTFLAFLAFAYSPLLRAGLLARDAELLLRAEDSTGMIADGAVLPIEALSLRVSRIALHTLSEDPPDVSEAATAARPAARTNAVIADQAFGGFWIRFENLLILLGAAVALGFLTRRLLLPWCGSELSLAAARSAGAIFALHPLSTSAVAGLEARGDLLGLLFGLTSGAFFLHGRQDRRPALMVLSVACAAVAAFASRQALLLPFFLAAFELTSSHRYRPLGRRMRTATTTLFAFGAAAFLELGVRSVQAGSGDLTDGVAQFGDLASASGIVHALGLAAEKLGLLILPANTIVLGIGGPLLAGAAFLLAVQPALLAARSAPRLWGWLLTAWLAALVATGLAHVDVRVHAVDIVLAHVLLPSTAVMAVGLGLSATALSGPRKPYVSWAVMLVYAALAFSNARPWTQASLEVAHLREELTETRERVGPGMRILVIDPPAPVGGVDPLQGSLVWLDSPEAGPREAGFATRSTWSVRGVSREAFDVLRRSPEFARLCAQGLCLSIPVELLPDDVVAEAETPVLRSGRRARRRAFPLPAFEPSTGLRTWRGVRSPELDLAPLVESTLVATARGDDDPADLGPVSWTLDAPGPQAIWGRTPDGLVGVFDLSGSFAWLLQGRVRRLWFDEGTLETRNEVLRGRPSFARPLEPRRVEDDWRVERPEIAFEPLSGERGRFVLSLFDPDTYEHERIRMRVEGNELVAPDAGRIAAGRFLVWSVDWIVGDVVLLRDGGRRQGEESG